MKILHDQDYREIERRRKLSVADAGAEVALLVETTRRAKSSRLDISGYRIGALPSLSTLPPLEELDCSQTEIDDLGPIASLSQLSELDCSSTSVADLSPLSELSRLKSLSFDNCKVVDLSPLKNLRELTFLACRSLLAVDFEPVQFLQKLAYLYFAQSKPENLEVFSKLTNLRSINCTGSSISDLGFLSNLENLQWLNCPFNDIVDLSPLSRLVTLEYLGIHYTKIRELGPLSVLRKLRYLDFGHTEVADLKPLSSLIQLEDITCYSTKVENLAPLAGLANLKSITFYDTHVGDLTPLAGLTNLRSLHCDRTRVGEIGPLAGLTELETLDCADTGIRDLRSVAGLAALKSLDCSNTQVDDLAPLSTLSNLVTLTCNQLSIREWPKGLFALPQLSEVYALDARIGAIPREELSQGYRDNCLPRLLSYFQDLAFGAEPLERVKLIVLGNGQVGKTQLRRWLLNSPANPTPFDPTIPSTHGIEVLRGAVSIPDPAGGTPSFLDASIWDFGGQDIYHGTHGLFMKTRAIFLLCWSPKEEGRREQELGGFVHQNQPIAYWVDYVRQLAGTDNPVIVVQTQCDTAADAQPHRHADLDHVGFDFLRPVSFSAKTNRGGAALRESIGEAAEWLKLRHGVPLIGKGRLEVLNRLESWRSEDACRRAEVRAHKLLTQDEFAALCSEAGGIAKPRHLLNFLHHAGVVFYREGVFGDHIVLDQDWALAAIYSAFDRTKCYPLLKAMRGRFTADLLGRLVWQDYSEEEQQVFLGMMQSCGIAFVHHYGRGSADSEYIAPDLLPDRDVVCESIESRWYGPDIPVTATLRFPLLHQGLIRQVLATVGAWARLNADYWRTGVLFYERERQSTALIEAVADESGWGGEIRIACRAGRAQELLALLVKQIREIAEQTGLSPDSVEGDVPEAPTPERRGAPAVPIEIAAPPRLGPRWYVSYAWGDATDEGRARDAQVDDLCRRAAEQGITILRDRDRIRNNDSIRHFMEELAGGDRIIVILSAKYLKSPYCMFELYQAWRRQQGDEALFAGVIRAYRLPDAAIGDLKGRAEIGRYWAEKVALDGEYLRYAGARDAVDWQLARHYALDVADILYAINDRVSPLDWDAFCNWAFEP